MVGVLGEDARYRRYRCGNARSKDWCKKQESVRRIARIFFEPETDRTYVDFLVEELKRGGWMDFSFLDYPGFGAFLFQK